MASSRTFEAFVDYERRHAADAESAGAVEPSHSPTSSKPAPRQICDAEVDRVLLGESAAMPRPDSVAGSTRVFTVHGGPRGPLLIIGGRATADSVRRARNALQRDGDSPTVELNGGEFLQLASLSDGPDIAKALDLVFDIKRVFQAFAPTVIEVRSSGPARDSSKRRPQSSR